VKKLFFSHDTGREAKKPLQRKEPGWDFLRCEIPKYVTSPAVPYFNLNAHLAPNMYHNYEEKDRKKTL